MGLIATFRHWQGKSAIIRKWVNTFYLRSEFISELQEMYIRFKLEYYLVDMSECLGILDMYDREVPWTPG